MEKIVCIAGGIWQKPWISYLKNKGEYIVVVNPVVTEATLLADYHIKADINDLEEINKHLEQIQPTLITSDQSDISTMIVAKLSEHWNLRGNNVKTIEKLTNKFEIFKFARSLGIPVPESALVFSLDEIKEFGRLHGFPIIIKPVDSTMSRGFRKIESESDINQFLYDSTKKFSKSGSVIVQKFIEGEMVTLEGVCSGGKHKTIAVSKKDGFFKPGINTGVRYPYFSNLTDKIIECNDLYVESTGMKFGLTHSEYIFFDNNFCLIEVGGRGGGAGITDKIVPWVSGIDVYELLYQSLIGQIIDVKSLKLANRPALLRYYTENQMENWNQNKDDAIKSLKGVSDFNYNFAGKQYVKDENDNRHTMAIYLGDSLCELESIENSIQFILNN